MPTAARLERTQFLFNIDDPIHIENMKNVVVARFQKNRATIEWQTPIAKSSKSETLFVEEI